MKKTICFVLAVAGILIIGCNDTKKDAKINPYEGAWECTGRTFFVHYLNGLKPDTTVVVPIPYTVKLLTKKHYAQGRQTEKNEVVAGGGEYTYEGDTFTSYPKYHSIKENVGKTLVWKSKIEGDLWTFSSFNKNDTIQLENRETWKRIIE
jgi:hypothetical protein